MKCKNVLPDVLYLRLDKNDIPNYPLCIYKIEGKPFCWINAHDLKKIFKDQLPGHGQYTFPERISMSFIDTSKVDDEKQIPNGYMLYQFVTTPIFSFLSVSFNNPFDDYHVNFNIQCSIDFLKEICNYKYSKSKFENIIRDVYVKVREVKRTKHFKKMKILDSLQEELHRV